MPAIAEEVTILALGDSLTQGYGLPAEAGLVPQLQGWMQARGADVKIINAGVSGDTTRGGLNRVDWSLTDEVDAVMIALGGNDLLRGIPLNSIEANLEQIIQKVKAKNLPVMLVGYRATANFGPEYKGAFDEMYPRIAARHPDMIFMPYIFQGMGKAMGRGEMSRTDGFQRDGIHPNAQGVKLNVAEIGPYAMKLYARAGG
ncbi:arylesterase [uncultured Maritimibacter sp.]|uniref:arylesterase n=1 Tax=uncultured Maritimibacter sp. TaxID=991866 RepID=UPI0025938D78|nr:arylesterase [uncultured Maritimibacter sp.]